MTKLDNALSIAVKLYEVVGNLQLIKEAQDEGICRLERMTGRGIKTRTKEAQIVSGALNAVVDQCREILGMTGKKSNAMYACQSKEANERFNLEQEKFLDIAMRRRCNERTTQDDVYAKLKSSRFQYDANSSNTMEPNTEDSSCHQREIRSLRASTLSSNTTNRTYPCKVFDPDTTAVTIHVNEKKEVTLPLPHNKCAYNIAEFIMLMDTMILNHEVKGWKAIITALNKLHMLKMDFRAAKKMLDNYVESGRKSGILPDDREFIIRMGRKRLIPFKEIPERCNKRVHSTVSLVTDPFEDAADALSASVRNQLDVSDLTVKNYATLSVVNDKNISLTHLSSSRLKSVSRIIASTSHRTLATHVLGIILSEFRVGKWHSKPKKLSEGAELAVKIAKIMLRTDDVHPISSRYITSFDSHGYQFIPGEGKTRQRSKVGKTSTVGGNRINQKGISSDYSEAKDADNVFKGVNVKEHEVNCAAGQRGRKCIQFYGLHPDEVPEGILILKINGLGYGQDMKANSDEFGYAIFSQSSKKTNANNDSTPNDDDVSVHMLVSQFIHQEIVLPFIADLRKGDPCISWSEDMPVPKEASAVFKLDSDIPYLSVLKHPEIVHLHKSRDIVIQKHAAGFTECGSANDRQQLFKNTKHNQRRTSCSSINTALKQEALKSLKIAKGKGLLKLSRWKFEAIIDCIASNNIINDKSCKSRETIQNGYVATGEISRDVNNVGYIACPDAFSIIRCTKNRQILNNYKEFARKLFPIARAYASNGSLSEAFFDAHTDDNGRLVFPLDKMPDGETNKIKKFTHAQYHLMRTTLPHHKSFIERETLQRDLLHRKKVDAILKKHDDALSLFSMNSEAEEKLKRQSKGHPISTCTAKHFSTLTAKLLDAFVKVRLCSDLFDPKLKQIPTTKGKCEDFDFDDEIEGTAIPPETALALCELERPILLQIAYKLRGNDVIALQPERPTIPSHIVPSIPLLTPCQDIDRYTNFEPDETWMRSVCSLIANCNERQQDFVDNCILRLNELKNTTLTHVLRARLTTHLHNYEKIDPTSPVWRFEFENFSRIAVILKILGYVRKDERLQTTGNLESLFHPDFLSNHEMLQECHSSQHGAYIIKDRETGIALRAGSASNKLGHPNKKGRERGRINSHHDDSLRRTNSMFYTYYPHKDSPHKTNGVRRGYFQDLDFIAAIRFKDEDKADVQNLFHWTEEVLRFLDERKPKGKQLLQKKHRLVCYLFETTLQLCLSPVDNISSNPGCETFAMVWDEGFASMDVDAYLYKPTNTTDLASNMHYQEDSEA